MIAKYYRRRLKMLFDTRMMYFSIKGNREIRRLHNLLDKEMFREINYEITCVFIPVINRSNTTELVDLYIKLKTDEDNFFKNLIIKSFDKKIKELENFKNIFNKGSDDKWLLAEVYSILKR